MHVLDVGANIGYFTLICAQAVGDEGHVWAFEPVRSYRESLDRHLATNRLADRVTVVPVGLSDAPGDQSIACDLVSAALHYVPSDLGGVPHFESIELQRLDDIAARLPIGRVDFIKVDIDGHEPAFLRGARETINRWHPLMVMEFAQSSLHIAGSDVRALAGELRALGYLLCHEATGRPYDSELDFLKECGNFDRSANVFLLPANSVDNG
jgi:FkbM family methyltransferase